ncbi:MAG: hypothetical protein Q4B52_07045 [Tissierellia bacterium]|nr:hypothetical protein [Tissierellia bacterium]
MNYLYIDKKTLRNILIATLILVISSSIENLMIAKDYDYFIKFHQITNLTIAEYNLINLIRYIFDIILYIIYAIIFYLAYKKGFFTKISKWTFDILLIASILMKILEMDIYNIFFYIGLICRIYILIKNHMLNGKRGKM